jgi:hypothetical protein
MARPVPPAPKQLQSNRAILPIRSLTAAARPPSILVTALLSRLAGRCSNPTVLLDSTNPKVYFRILNGRAPDGAGDLTL